MTKIFKFILALVLAQSFTQNASSVEPGVPGDVPPKVNRILDDNLMAPGPIEDRAELELSKQAYLGNGGMVCKTIGNTKCHDDGACCKGGARCRLLYEKIKSLSSWYAGWKFVNFCSSE